MTLLEACAAISAICGLPTALRTATSLLSRTKPDVDGARQELTKLGTSLRDFCHVHHWLSEAKVLHDFLTNVQIALRQPVEESRRFLDQRLNLEVFKVSEIGKNWRTVVGPLFARLISFAESMTDLEEAPLVRAENGTFESGPNWLRQLLAARDEIDRLLKRYASGKMTTKDYQTLADRFDGMDATLASQMGQVNEMIRKIAGELESSLRQVLGGLDVVAS